MFFKSRIFQFIIAIISIVGYGYIAFAVLTPGQTLDPVGEGWCTGPSDPACQITFASGGSLSIGDLIGNSPIDHGLLYTDASGNLASDAGFIRNLVTGETSFATTGLLDGSTIINKQGEDVISISGLSAPFEGNISKTTNGDFETSLYNAHLDVSAFASQPAGTFFAEQAALTFLDSNLDESANIYVQKLPGVFGGNITTRMQIETGSGFSSFSGLEYDGTNISWSTRILDGVSADNLLAFSDVDSLEWRWGSDVIWKMPTVQGTAGQTLVLDTDNETLIWDTISGGGDILLDSSNTFYSTNSGYVADDVPNSIIIGFNAGSGFNDVLNGYSNFLGYQAGSDATNASHSNFFGPNAGSGATYAGSSNFFGNQAGGSATNASNSNFFGGNAGAGATNASQSNFFGGLAGWQAVNAANSIFIGQNSGSNDTVDNTTANTTDSCDSIACWSILFGPGTNTGGFSNSIAIGGGAENTATNQFMLADTITNVRWRGVEYELPSAQGGSGEFLTNDGSGVLSWSTAVGDGTGPISVGTSGNTLYSSGLSGTGQGNTEFGNNIILGVNAGGGTTTGVFESNFIGLDAGRNAISGFQSNFFGREAGKDTSNAQNSNFFGNRAGFGAEGAAFSNFFGYRAGMNATKATYSLFIGYDAGYNDSVDNTSSNLGDSCNGTKCWSILLGNNINTGGFSNSILLGGATTGTYSNTATNQFMLADSITNVRWRGVEYELPSAQGGSGEVLTNDGSGVLSWAAAGGGGSGPISIGTSGNTLYSSGLTGTGQGNTITGDNIILGTSAGLNATSVYYSNFFGNSAGSGATSANSSNFFGYTAGQGATGASNSNFLGNSAGSGATGAANSNFLGINSGNSATGAQSSNFLGSSAGNGATSASFSNFLGNNSGSNATNATGANFFGYLTGSGATGASNSNFLGTSAGNGATGASFSNFFGHSAGLSATSATRSNFFGQNAGSGATSSSYSTFIGTNAGRYNSGSSLGSPNANNSIFIGNNAGYSAADTGLDNNGNGTSILIGENTSTGGYSRSIALGESAVNTATNQFMIGSSTSRIEELVFNGGAGNTCSIVAGTGISCSSDERLKTNIVDLENDTLSKINQLRTVTYNWKEGINQDTQIGFIAQNINEYFPELVSTNNDGMLAVNYAGMTPVLTKAIQELDLKITDIESFAVSMDTTFIESMRNWLGDAFNGIKKIRVDNELCIGETCITESDLQNFKAWQGTQGGGQSVSAPEPDNTTIETTPIVSSEPEVVPDPVLDVTPGSDSHVIESIPEQEVTPEVTPEITPEPEVVPEPEVAPESVQEVVEDSVETPQVE